MFGSHDKTTRDRLTGSWRLISFTLKHPGGRETHPYGKDPIGLLSYDGHRHMAGQIMSRRRPAFASERPRGGTDDEVRAAFDGYIAYFGTYAVDETASVVTHQVEGSLLPNWIGTPQRRDIAFRDNRLVLSAAIEAGIVVEIVWERR